MSVHCTYNILCWYTQPYTRVSLHNSKVYIHANNVYIKAKRLLSNLQSVDLKRSEERVCDPRGTHERRVKKVKLFHNPLKSGAV